MCFFKIISSFIVHLLQGRIQSKSPHLAPTQFIFISGTGMNCKVYKIVLKKTRDLSPKNEFRIFLLPLVLTNTNIFKKTFFLIIYYPFRHQFILILFYLDTVVSFSELIPLKYVSTVAVIYHIISIFKKSHHFCLFTSCAVQYSVCMCCTVLLCIICISINMEVYE